MTEALPPDDADVTRTAVGADRMLAPGTLLAGRYRIVEMVGIGGMGMVYRAHDEELDLEVAVKILRAERAADEGLRERFRRELILARQVSHRNVVRIHDIGSDGALWFLTMDFVAGRSLGQALADDGPLPAETVVELGIQLVAGLEAAHDEGVVHRDLKPGNVLLDEDDRLYVTDFGIARSLATSGLTVTGQVIGTPDYLAPEQVRGEKVDRRADLYACGLILFEALTGRRPFRGGTLSEVMAQRLSGRPRRPGELGVEVPAQLEAVIDRCLERDPDDRYQDAGELLADLRAIAAGGAVARRRRRRRAWRPPRWALAGLAVLAAVVLAAVAWVLRPAEESPPPVAEEPLHSVAVLPLVDRTGRQELAWLSTGVSEIVSASLAESPRLRVVDSERVARTLADLGLEPAGLKAADLVLLADLLDVDRLLTGSVNASDERLWFFGRLVSFERRTVAAAKERQAAESAPRTTGSETVTVEGEGDDGFFRLAERLTRQLRSRLGVSEDAASMPSEPAAGALRQLSLGLVADRRGEPDEAQVHLERAVTADPAYAAAWDALAGLRERQGRLDQALAAAESAVAALGAGPADEPAHPSRLRLRAAARRAALAGDPQAAQSILQRAVETFPYDHELRLQLAESLAGEGLYSEAQAVLAEVTRRDPRHPRAWYLRGRYAILDGDPGRARDGYLVQALVVNKRLGDRRGEADVLNALGVAAQQLGEVEEAIESYRQAGELRRGAGDLRGYSATLTNLAYLQSLDGDHEAAAGTLAEALAIGERLGDRAGLANLHNHLGFVEEQRGRYRRALEEFRRARELFGESGDSAGLAESEHNVGFAHFVLGEYDTARSHLATALELYRRVDRPEGVVFATQSVGQVELARGRWNAALSSFVDALETSRELGLTQPEAISHANLGRIAQYQGRYDAALSSYRQALERLEEIGDPRGLAEYTLFEVDALTEVGLLDAAEERLGRIAAWLDEADNREQRSELARVEGMVALARRRPRQATAAFERAVRQAADSGSPVAELAAELGLGAAELAAGEPLSARSRLEPVAAAAAEIGHVPLRLEAAAVLASAYRQAGDPESAVRTAREALELVGRIGSWAGAYRLHLHLAESLEANGAPAEARAELVRAKEQLERLREGLAADQTEAFDHLPEVLRIERQAGQRAA